MRPSSAYNLELLLQVTTRNVNKSTIASILGLHMAQVTRRLRGVPLKPHEMDQLGEYFGFGKLGLANWILESEPAEFRRELARVGFGKYESMNRAQAYLEELPLLAGYFLPENFLMPLLGRGESYRGFGVEGPESEEVPNASGFLGQRYGLALEVASGEVADAVRGGRAYALLLHQVRGSRDLTVAELGAKHLFSAGAPLFVRAVASDPYLDESEVRTVAVLAEYSNEEGTPRAGYKIAGLPGRRDVYIFLFAEAPQLGDHWRGVGPDALVSPDMLQSLMNVIRDMSGLEDFKSSCKVMQGHVVFDAVAR